MFEITLVDDDTEPLSNDQSKDQQQLHQNPNYLSVNKCATVGPDTSLHLQVSKNQKNICKSSNVNHIHNHSVSLSKSSAKVVLRRSLRKHQNTTGNCAITSNFSGNCGNSIYGNNDSHNSESSDQTQSATTMPEIIFGICAMEKKAKSDPIQQITKRLSSHGHSNYSNTDQISIKILIFDEKTILNEKVEDWPKCQILLAWFSDGFPLDKAKAYVDLHKKDNIISLNDIDMQYTLLDRSKIYKLLEENDVPIPKYIVCDPNSSPIIEEFDDSIIVNGTTFNKPFVEKPISAEDHNIIIYFSSAGGGGSCELFRKIKNISSTYSNNNKIRRDASYIYEEFKPTDGHDLKIYTVGDQYAHSEARKAPSLDGVVERGLDNKEKRYPILLSPSEKEIAMKVNQIFKQTLCGFDLLRVQGNKSKESESFVCDVNGFSLVKTSKKYYDDCANILKKIIKHKIITQRLKDTTPMNFSCGTLLSEKIRRHSQPGHVANFRSLSVTPDMSSPVQSDSSESTHSEDLLRRISKSGHGRKEGNPNFPGNNTMHSSYSHPENRKLKCAIAVVRHGDRTPKQKIKFHVSHSAFKNFYKDNTKKENFGKELKLKSPSDLTEVLNIVTRVVNDHQASQNNIKNYIRVQSVLQQHGEFQGINRKVQIKPIGKDKNSEEYPEKVQLIFKWGGELTKRGSLAARNLGKKFRKEIYASSDRDDAISLPTGGVPDLGNLEMAGTMIDSSLDYESTSSHEGLLRLHSSYRHDLKIYASEEGRVQMTAASFTKGLLSLEGAIPPILAHMVRSANQNKLLDDDDNKVDKKQQQIKQELREILGCQDSEVSLKKVFSLSSETDDKDKPAQNFINCLDDVDNRPIEKCQRVYEMMGKLLEHVQQIYETNNMADRCDELNMEGSLLSVDQGPGVPYTQVYHNEKISLLLDRWQKLYNEFKIDDSTTEADQTKSFDFSKIPDIYDMIKYDLLHNERQLPYNYAKDLIVNAGKLAAIIVPGEYGITPNQKLKVALGYCRPLLTKIEEDLKHTVDNSHNKGYLPVKLNTQQVSSVNFPNSSHKKQPGVRTRLYFTSESHLHGLLNCLIYGVPEGKEDTWKSHACNNDILNKLQNVELNYLTQIIIQLYEDVSMAKDSQERFTIKIKFSPGEKSSNLAGNRLGSSKLGNSQELLSPNTPAYGSYGNLKTLPTPSYRGDSRENNGSTSLEGSIHTPTTDDETVIRDTNRRDNKRHSIFSQYSNFSTDILESDDRADDHECESVISVYKNVSFKEMMEFFDNLRSIQDA